MKEQCFIHPNVDAINICHNCNRHYCADCLQEGKEYYYCLAPECQVILRIEKLPSSLPCPNCSETLSLSEEERLSKQFRCPACNKFIDFSEDDGTLQKFSFDIREPDLYFAVSKQKLIVLSFATLGLYQIYWFWLNWKLVQSRSAQKLSPIWRSIFTLLFCYDMFSKIKSSAESYNLSVTYSPGWLTLLYIILNLSWRLPSPFDLIGFSALFVLLPVQSTINSIAEQFPEKTKADRSYSGLNILAIVVGSILIFLIMVGTLSGE